MLATVFIFLWASGGWVGPQDAPRAGGVDLGPKCCMDGTSYTPFKVKVNCWNTGGNSVNSCCRIVVNVWASYVPKVLTSSGVVDFRRSAQDPCNVCFGRKEHDCFAFDSVICEFYTETSKLIGNDVMPMPPMPKQAKNPQLRAEVNALLFSVIETGRNEQKDSKIFDECIPYVSTYTDCDKENICTGCESCECDAWGRWNCTIGRKCRPDIVRVMANHETLVNVIENLKRDDSTTRKKRSLDKWDQSGSSFEFPYVDRFNQLEQTDWTNQESTTVNILNNDYATIHIESSQPVKQNENKKLIKLVLRTLVNDALPEILAPDSQEYDSNRVKRWIADSDTILHRNRHGRKAGTKNYTNITLNITLEELSDWLNDVHPILHLVNSNFSIDKVTPVVTEDVGTFNTDPPETTSVSPDNLVFEEVYDSVATDSKNHTLRKPLINKSSDINMYDDIYFDDHNTDTTTAKKNEQIKEGLFGDTESLINYLEKNLDNYQSTTEIFADLLKSSDKNELNKETDTVHFDNADLDSKVDDNMLTAVNIMKRDLSSTVNKTKLEENISSNNTSMTSVKKLKDDVLDPIDNILKDKQKEIEDLLKVRESLNSFINAHKNDLNKTNKSTILSIYKVEVLPHHHHELNVLRKSNNGTLLNKYLAKLKKDMFEVIRDVISIRKLYSDKNQVPQEFKYLIKAMNHYIHKTGFHPKRRKLNYVKYLKEARRSNRLSDSSPSLVKSQVVKVLEVLDKNKPEHCALIPISPFAQRVLKRIINKYYVDVFAAAGLRVHDPNYNLTNDLKIVGSRWTLMTAQIEKAPIYEKLHHMKMLQLVISVDIAKVKDALMLIRFAKSRRMALADETKGEKIVDGIHKSLQQLSKLLVHITKEKSTILKNPHILPKQTNKKDSFLNQIKKMLLNSKKDIISLFNRKVPKTDIVKLIARKEIEEKKKKKLADTMHKWQSNLNIISNVREKRSVMTSFDGLSKRMKSIIPKYLRGKVPSIAKKSKGKKKLRGNGTSGNKMATDNSKVNQTTTTLNTSTTNLNTAMEPTTHLTALESSSAAASSVASLLIAHL